MKNINNIKNIEKNFLNYLSEMNLSRSSIKNYKSDISYFIRWLNYKYPKGALSKFSLSAIDEYISFLRSSKTSYVTINRRLTTLRHFTNFLVERGFIDRNFMKQYRNVDKRSESDMRKLLGFFEENLLYEGVSGKSAKNYKSDVKSYISWLYKLGMGQEDINSETSSAYHKELLKIRAERSVKRSKTCVNRFIRWFNKDEEDFVLSSVKRKKTIADLPKKPTVPVILFITAIILLITQIVISTDPVASPAPVSALDSYSLDTVESETSEKELYSNLKDKKISIILDDKTLPHAVTANAHFNEENMLVLELVDEESPDSVLNMSESGNYIAGASFIPAGKTEYFIYNPEVRENSFIYITPKTSTENQIVYVKSQGDGFFVAAIDNPLNRKLGFNWILINI